MKAALDHKTKYFISAVEFVKKYGNDANDKGEHAICPACRSNVNIRANHQANRCTHFSHFPKTQCPIVTKGKEKYSHLIPVEENPLIVEERKKNFVELSVKTYLKCHMLCDRKFYSPEYEELLKVATDKGMWSYHGLVLEYVPYMLLTFKDMTRKKHHKRQFNLRFVFNSEIKSYDDLWIRVNGQVDIIRLSLKGSVIYEQAVYGLNILFNEDDWLTEDQRRNIVNRTKEILNI